MRLCRFFSLRFSAGLAACLAACLVLAPAAPVMAQTQAKYEERLREIRLITTLESSLFAAAEAEKLAVMADTDEASVDFAGKAVALAASIEKDRGDLAALVKQGKLDKEAALLADFDACWAQYRALDKEILDLAVKNTNLKAARLSQGQARELVTTLAGCLTQAVPAAGDPSAAQVRELADKALIAVQQVQILHAPHIDESGAARMDDLEAQMQARLGEARDALAKASGLLDETGKARLQSCAALVDDYSRITADIVALSRQNTNLDSLRLSLSRKRAATASCSEILAALKKTAFDRGFKATR